MDYIINKTVKKNTGTICDPSCGTSVFLIGDVKRLHKLTGRPVSEIIENNIYGADILVDHIKYCKILLILYMLSTGEDKKLLSFNLRVCNSLTFDWKKYHPHGFDSIICNPPYVKSRGNDIDQVLKDKVKEKFTTVHGMWDLYVPFMELGLTLLKPNGRFGMIVKDTLGEIRYTDRLIDFIEKNYHLYQIDFFPKIKIFKNVSVKNKIVFISNARKNEPARRILHQSASSDMIHLENVVGKEKYLQTPAKFLIKRKNTLLLGDICFTSYGLRLNSDKDDTLKFQKKDLVSNKKSKFNRIYTEGKYLESFVITKELFVEWGLPDPQRGWSDPHFQSYMIKKKF